MSMAKARYLTLIKQLLKYSSITSVALFLSLPSFAYSGCNSLPNNESRLLHSSKTINLCERFAKRPILVVNTASHCGFTTQFKGLEALYQQYKDQGLVVIGVPSNDFKQAASSEEKAAGVCFENHGVSFTMLAPTHVTGQSAQPLFKEINQQSEPPSWNFTKYLMDKKGIMVKRFASQVTPQSNEMRSVIEDLLTVP